MSAADRALASYRRALSIVGETVYIRRYTGGSGSEQTYSDIATTARVVCTGPASVEGNAQQYRYTIIALVDALSSILPVTDADRVVLDDGKQLAIIDPGDRKRRIGGTLIALEMICEG